MPLYQDRDWMERKYVRERLSATEIAAEIGCCKTTVYQWLKRFGIRVRSKGEAKAISWEQGVYDGMFTDEVRQRMSESISAAYREGRSGTSLHRARKASSVRRAWVRGDFDHVLAPSTKNEIALVALLDRLGIEHVSQYRPEGYSRVYDEFVLPNVLVEIHGDYWHSRPEVAKSDAEKELWALSNGYVYLAIWEHEITDVGLARIVRERIVSLIRKGL